MQIFVYEFITGGGLWSRPEWGEPAGTLLREGAAMLEAVASDFATLPDTDVVVLWDRRIKRQRVSHIQYFNVESAKKEQAELYRLAASSDLTLVIAPEIENVLTERCEAVIRADGKLLGSSLDFIRLASDKHLTVLALAAAGVPVPESFIVDKATLANCALPAVVKPRLGAGSLSVRRIETLDELTNLHVDQSFCVQPFKPGRPASVAVISSQESQLILPPCWQHFRDDRLFEYVGGELINDGNVIDRARRLALGVIEALPCASGYFGIDLVLGDSKEGADDFVIEINPRLTTSYVGLRAAMDINLAEAMLQIRDGVSVSISIRNVGNTFFADGRVTD